MILDEDGEVARRIKTLPAKALLVFHCRVSCATMSDTYCLKMDCRQLTTQATFGEAEAEVAQAHAPFFELRAQKFDTPYGPVEMSKGSGYGRITRFLGDEAELDSDAALMVEWFLGHSDAGKTVRYDTRSVLPHVSVSTTARVSKRHCRDVAGLNPVPTYFSRIRSQLFV
jgi:hypothetical protein